jgi:hypothetical protein
MLIVGLIFIFAGYIPAFRYLFVNPIPYYILLTATPLYLVALWADKTDKYLSPKARADFWVYVSCPIVLAGFLSGYVFYGLVYVLEFFHLLRPFAILLGRLCGWPTAP